MTNSIIKVTELNTFVGSNEMMVKVTFDGLMFSATVLTDCHPESDYVGGSEMFTDVESIEELNELLEEAGYDDILVNVEVPSFEFEGTHITNPYYDETLREEVDPIEYYGLTPEQLKAFEGYKPL
jgi:hypothetical protein